METLAKKKYDIHKYWGKKPSIEIRKAILKNSSKNDVLLDPFSGYGGLAIEGLLTNRNVVANDLNPIANFILSTVVNPKFSEKLFLELVEKLEKDLKTTEDYWYKVFINEEYYYILSTLRDSKDKPIAIKALNIKSNKVQEFNIDDYLFKEIFEKEKNYKINEWFPVDELLKNSRISAKEGQKVSDLFTTTSLASHAKLYEYISKIVDSNEKDLIKLAFSSNLANCSKLVPPIKSRGRLSQGAWMTGFYIGSSYIDNNVFHYFRNRLKKALKGKIEFIKEYYENNSKSNWVKISSDDARFLKIKSSSIDYVFTDFPYGDVVPYFEQSIIWNSWLGYKVNYLSEIVISDSKGRNKNLFTFSKDIDLAIKEIHRVLKAEKNFTFTYHSLSGKEWIVITNSLIKNGFSFVRYEWIKQKTFTPRQINRLSSVKGDLIFTVKKKPKKMYKELDEKDTNDFIEAISEEIIDGNEELDTNKFLIKIVFEIFSKDIILTPVDFISIIKKNCYIDKNAIWRKK